MKLWTGWTLSGAPALMLLGSGAMKLAGPPGLAEGFSHLGWPLKLATPLGIVEIVCTLLYLAPRTCVLGAILLTGYMGGAIATHMRIGEPFIVQILIGMAIWGGLCLRDTRIEQLIPAVRETR
ncbi:MAG: DoxX family protein [Acidobacteria bacterium]|nr:DoxX family protein [Acidobacteriota bacterium]